MKRRPATPLGAYYGQPMGPVPPPAELNLKQVVAELCVRDLTAYRYVRTGRLAARKIGPGWVVTGSDLQRFIEVPADMSTASSSA